MSEKRFKLIKPLGTRLGLTDISIKDTQEDYYYNTKEMVVDLLNRLSEENEQLKIANAKWLDKALQDKQIRYSNANCKELTKKYLQLKEENEQLKAKLKEKEEDEQLYANEILELRETNKQWSEFKELGGDY